ncbi:hypothetical protein NB718_002009 [Xanthomonas sacchari]|nr:hypothetical protein [Xanthomonas sacchari]
MQKKQGNFRVFCNGTLPRSPCGQASAKRRREPRRCTPACPLAEKKIRDRTRFRHRTSANAQKCANFFASCGAHDARDACVPRRRVVPHRATATRPARTSPTHRDAHDCPRPPPCQVASASSGDAVARSCRPAQLAEVIDWRRHAPRRHASAKRAARTASPMPARRRPASCLHAALHLRRVGKPAPTDAPIVGIGHRQTRRTRCARGAPGGELTWSSQRRRRRAFRDRHAEMASADARTLATAPSAPKKKPAALGGRFGYRDGRSAQWPSSSSSSAYSSGDSSSFNCSASSASSTRIQPSP